MKKQFKLSYAGEVIIKDLIFVFFIAVGVNLCIFAITIIQNMK